MKKKIEVILQHGWAFDSSCWRAWMPHLKENQDCEITVQTPDRGYFDTPKQAIPFQNTDSLKVIILHSLGLHLLPEEIIQSADLLVIASSFSNFHSGSTLESKISKRKIASMIRRIDESPVDLINDFYRTCYSPLLTKQLLLMPTPRSMNVEQLRADLHLLDSNVFDLQNLRRAAKVLFVHGSEDEVVASSHSIRMNEELNNSDIIMFEGAGHSLPLTHVAPVWISLRSKLRHLLAVSLK